ncbi:C40 family peptidase [Alloalcanivorax sp. C16-1]|uniref:C40 family peptidase n=1 Tax=Alloalcanivorax sp. C16-1 TaxID=3390051 RepID=UPI00397084C3
MIDLSDFIGIPFRAGGRDRSGCDCWGLLRLIYRERLGLELPSFDGYQEPVSAQSSALIQANRGDWQLVASRADWDVGRAVPGELDAVLFTVGGRPNHIGVVVAPGQMIHSAAGKDSCREAFTSPTWRSRIEGFYRAC